MLRSPLARALIAVGAVVAFYLLGVGIRQHLGTCVDIRNSSAETVRQVSVKVEGGGKTYDVPDLAPGDHRRVYVQPSEKSRVILTIMDSRTSRLHDITVVENAQPGECALSTVSIQPLHRTQSVETHQSVCWNGWLSLM